MKVWSSPYVLRARARLSSKATDKQREGSLIRIESDNGELGYADLFPWPELGDERLKDQLLSIREGRPHRLAQRSLTMAAQDAQARGAGVSLFAGRTIPESHHLITDLLDGQLLQEAIDSGATRIKAKAGANLTLEMRALRELLESACEDAKIRLDFNESLPFTDTKKLVLDHLGEVAGRIDFVEDPCVYDAECWRFLEREAGIAVAIDRRSSFCEALSGFSVVVIKPAIQVPGKIVEHCVSRGLRVVFTSYLDHPVGQLHAAWQAAQARDRYGKIVDTAGLLSQVAYHPTAWSEQIVSTQGKMKVPSGAGIGFGKLLEQESWRLLC